MRKAAKSASNEGRYFRNFMVVQFHETEKLPRGLEVWIKLVLFTIAFFMKDEELSLGISTSFEIWLFFSITWGIFPSNWYRASICE